MYNFCHSRGHFFGHDCHLLLTIRRRLLNYLQNWVTFLLRQTVVLKGAILASSSIMPIFLLFLCGAHFINTFCVLPQQFFYQYCYYHSFSSVFVQKILNNIEIFCKYTCILFLYTGEQSFKYPVIMYNYGNSTSLNDLLGVYSFDMATHCGIQVRLPK